MTITKNNLRSLHTNLSPYCHFSKEEDFIEVTDWANGEGKDIQIETSREVRTIRLTHGEFQAISCLWNYCED